MNKLKSFIYKILNAIYLICKGKQLHGVRILMYHSIDTDVADDPNSLFTVSLENFKSQINFLLHQENIEFSAFSEEAFSLSNKLKVVLTFDDGYKNNLTLVAPYLVQHNIPFAVFVSTDKVLKHHRDYLTPKELLELSKIPGVTIGSHSASHRPMTQLSDEEVKKELMQSKQFLEGVIGKTVDCISFPHGAYSARIIQFAKELGYRLGGCSQPGLNTSIQEKLVLQRTVIMSIDDKISFKQKVYGGWDWRSFEGSFSQLS